MDTPCGNSQKMGCMSSGLELDLYHHGFVRALPSKSTFGIWPLLVNTEEGKRSAA